MHCHDNKSKEELIITIFCKLISEMTQSKANVRFTDLRKWSFTTRCGLWAPAEHQCSQVSCPQVLNCKQKPLRNVSLPLLSYVPFKLHSKMILLFRVTARVILGMPGGRWEHLLSGKLRSQCTAGNMRIWLMMNFTSTYSSSIRMCNLVPNFR